MDARYIQAEKYAFDRAGELIYGNASIGIHLWRLPLREACRGKVLWYETTCFELKPPWVESFSLDCQCAKSLTSFFKGSLKLRSLKTSSLMVWITSQAWMNGTAHVKSKLSFKTCGINYSGKWCQRREGAVQCMTFIDFLKKKFYLIKVKPQNRCC